MKVLSMGARKQGRRRFPRLNVSRIGIILLLFSVLMLLNACNSIFSTPSQSGSSNTVADTTTPTPAVSTTATVGPTITTQVTGCPSNLSVNWDSLVGTHANVNKVQKVICGSLEGSGSLDTLIDVRYYSSDARLDFYVYNNLFGTPNQLFKVQGLLDGDAFISSIGTVVTAQVSPNDPFKGQADLFKEYQWNGTAFGQILFPGIYPDVTRYQAEKGQALVSSEIAALQPGQPANQIHDAWRISPSAIVSRMAKTIFHWSNVTVTLPSHATQLTVLNVSVTNLGTGGGGFVAIIHHLNDVLTDIYEVWQVTSINGSAALGSPAVDAQLTSPVSVSGSSIVNGNVVGQVVLYDDMYITVGTSGAIHSPATSGYAQFTQSVSYHLNASGLEEGVVAFYPTNQNNIALSNQAVMIKVFLSA